MKQTQFDLAKMVKEVETKYKTEKEKTRRLAKDNDTLKKKILTYKKALMEKNTLGTIEENEEDPCPRRKTLEGTK